MKVQIYGIKTCDSCRKARASLPDADFIDIRETPLTETKLTRFLDTFGSDLVNRRSTTWRGLSDAERSRAPLELLSEHPTLMKRPVIVSDDGTLYLGWTPQVRTALGI